MWDLPLTMAAVGGGATCKREQVRAQEVGEHVAGGGGDSLPAQGGAETGYRNAQVMLTARFGHCWGGRVAC